MHLREEAHIHTHRPDLWVSFLSLWLLYFYTLSVPKIVAQCFFFSFKDVSVCDIVASGGGGVEAKLFHFIQLKPSSIPIYHSLKNIFFKSVCVSCGEGGSCCVAFVCCCFPLQWAKYLITETTFTFTWVTVPQFLSLVHFYGKNG